MKIHLCDKAQQPDIHYACGKWTTPWTRFHKETEELPAGVFRGDDKELYTFTSDLYTCFDCGKALRKALLDEIKKSPDKKEELLRKIYHTGRKRCEHGRDIMGTCSVCDLEDTENGKEID